MTSYNDSVLTVLIFSPLLAAVVAAFIRNETWLRWWTLLFTSAAALYSLPLYTHFTLGTADFQFTNGLNGANGVDWIPALHLRYAVGVDGISLLLVLLTTLIMPLCVLASWRYIQTRVKGFMICLLVMETAMIGVFCALDLILFFVFWEAMLIPMALLIGIWGGPRKIYASLKFFIYTMSGSVFLLVAIIAMYLKARTFSIPEIMNLKAAFPANFQIWIFLAFFISFAIKVPMFPFHTWLPAAHVEAPTAGSVLLASVLLKMGTYGFLRFSLPMAPYATHIFTPYILWLSVVAILYGGLTALAQTDLKKLVAYSSVAHMGFATLGIFALNEMGLKGAMLVMVNHGVTTGALFIVVGIIYERLHTRDLGQTAGMGKTMPIFAMFAGVFALSSLAFPGTNSFIGEFLVMSGGFASAVQGAAPSVTMLMMVCVVPGVVLAAAYMLRMLQKVAYGGTRNPDHSHVKDLGLREILTLAPLLVFVFWIGLHPEPFTRVMDASVKHLMEQTARPPTGEYAVRPKAGSPQEGQEAADPKPEGRDPKEARNPKSDKPQVGHQEPSQPSPQARVPTKDRPFQTSDFGLRTSDFNLRISSFGFPSDFGSRISDFDLPSDLGFRISDLKPAPLLS
jgi:NADH-quinone oxidoreductase subunit M